MTGGVAATMLIAALSWSAYTYAGYPAILVLLDTLARRRRRGPDERPTSPGAEWPMVSICVPAHNAGTTIGDTVRRLIAIDYPADRRQIVIVDDASDDDTAMEAVRAGGDDVEVIRLGSHRGKTEGENAIAPRLRGDIVVNTDATVIVHPAAVKHLVRAFTDPSVGVASGRDVSVGQNAFPGGPGSAAAPGVRGGGVPDPTRGESVYVGYEMMVRALESRVDSLVGASGCLYAARVPIQRARLPGGVSRDFAAALLAREQGWRAVSVPGAICFVPRSASMHREFRRKARTITRGLATLIHFRHLLDPRRGATFAWMLFSHKLARWLTPVWAVVAVGALVALSPAHAWARLATVAIGAAGIACAVGSREAGSRPGIGQRALQGLAFAVSANLAVLAAWIRLVRGVNPPVWEPTRRSGDAIG